MKANNKMCITGAGAGNGSNGKKEGEDTIKHEPRNQRFVCGVLSDLGQL